jgi:sec-independent protein translocase protein TatB
VFDVGFWELTFLATLALLVLGPDKLPGVVSGVGRMLGRARALARGLKMQMEREFNDLNQPASNIVKPPAPSAPPAEVPTGEPPDTQASAADHDGGDAASDGSDTAPDSSPDEKETIR